MIFWITPEMSENTKSNFIYQNKPQLLVNSVDANESMHVMGRGTGKTTGILAPRAHRSMTFMPRSAGVNVAESYMQLLDRTLPPMIMRWEEMGLKRDRDFWVRKFPPRNIGLYMPYMSPETPEHSIFMRVNRYDVSVMRLVSQDRPGSANGMSVDWISGDEVKFLNKEQLDSELMPTNRGNERYFKDCHLHHGIMFTTDMPTSSSAKWIHEYEQHVDQDAIDLILLLQNELNLTHAKAAVRGRYTQAELSTIAKYSKELSKIRKHTIFYSEASTLDNIDVLGAEYIRKEKRRIPEFLFRTAFLNERPGKVENTFYPDLADKHFYNAMADCRKDLDLDRSKALEVALDVGGRINTISIGQESNYEIKIINAMHVVESGKNKIKHLAIAFHKYYYYYYKKEVIVYYDHTHIPANSVSDKNPLDEFTEYLESQGWIVTRVFIGVTPSFRNRYILWGSLLNPHTSTDQRLFTARFNKDNTTDLRTSMETTKIALGGKTGFEKDKRMERDEKANQLEAPHYSDSADILAVGMIKRRKDMNR